MIRAIAKTASVIALLAAPMFAEGLPAPSGDVILTVTGAGVTNMGGAAALDLAMLEEMGGTEIETSTIWTEGKQTFEGVPLEALIDRLEIEGETLSAVAINDYAVEIPTSDAVEGGPIIAYKMNGNPMSVRDKGPLWVIYPYDSDPAYQTEVIYSRSIWQLDRLDVVQ